VNIVIKNVGFAALAVALYIASQTDKPFVAPAVKASICFFIGLTILEVIESRVDEMIRNHNPMYNWHTLPNDLQVMRGWFLALQIIFVLVGVWFLIQAVSLLG
jgi:hypothetical protein